MFGILDLAIKQRFRRPFGDRAAMRGPLDLALARIEKAGRTGDLDNRVAQLLDKICHALLSRLSGRDFRTLGKAARYKRGHGQTARKKAGPCEPASLREETRPERDALRRRGPAKLLRGACDRFHASALSDRRKSALL